MAKPKNPKKTNGNAGVQPVAAASTTLPAAETAAAETSTPKKSARKPSIVKSEPRANLLPINVEEEIRRLAYLLSERRGFEPGHETEDWLTAEREVRQRYHQHSA
jgi:Protein of unknown function (DUF2934)